MRNFDWYTNTKQIQLRNGICLVIKSNDMIFAPNLTADLFPGGIPESTIHIWFSESSTTFCTLMKHSDAFWPAVQFWISAEGHGPSPVKLVTRTTFIGVGPVFLGYVRYRFRLGSTARPVVPFWLSWMGSKVGPIMVKLVGQVPIVSFGPIVGTGGHVEGKP